jgi:hypothetical protein
VVKACGVEAQSDDEYIDHGGSRVALTEQLQWRSPELVQVFRALDYVYIGKKITADGNFTTRVLPRDRVTGELLSTRSPVKGLPANCYNPGWLRTLSQEEKDDLHMLGNVDLNVSHELQRSVSFSLASM